MSGESINIQLVDKDEGLFHLLEMADPSRKRINSYLISGKCYIAKINKQLIGVMVLDELTPTSIEIKNIAIDEKFQGRGYGRKLLKYAQNICIESKYKKLVIGTGNSSIGQLALYQKEGFEIVDIKKNYFVDNYEESIFENGILCKHMIMLEKKVK